MEGGSVDELLDVTVERPVPASPPWSRRRHRRPPRAAFVAIVDQRNGVLVFNLSSSRWSGRAKWTFKPTGRAWKNLSDVRFRKYGGRTAVLVTASGVTPSSATTRPQRTPGPKSTGARHLARQSS